MSDLVLIDTNAWITFFAPDFRGFPEVASEVEKLIETGKASYTEIIYMELFVGITSDADARRFKSAFSGLPIATLVEPGVWVEAQQNAYKLWKAGVKFKLVDVIIASVAIHYEMTLFHHDRHFVEMKKALPLEELNLLSTR
jgi:predicted nucleic acid-binding protein